MRSVLAVVAGYLIFGIASFALFRLSGHDPHGTASLNFKVWTILLGMLFAFIGGYVTGVLAPRKPLTHGAALAILLATFAGISLCATAANTAKWTQVSAILGMAPAALLGSTLYAAQRRRAS
jgi:hypothetical protein